MKFDGENIVLDGDESDFIQIEQEDFLLKYINDNPESNKGANSNVFLLQDPNEEIEDRVIKICKSPHTKHRPNKRNKRFLREIDAFRRTKQHRVSNVIHFYRSGELQFGRSRYLYIILELAESDLVSYLENNHFEFNLNQKLGICVNILNGVRQLHNLGIYHRDIKHDNILVVNGQFKIGDLGLVDFRKADFQIDSRNDKIGPFGWLSPEATNKMLTAGKTIGHVYDCDINDKSDIFQLGKLFWYIFQGNLPVGQMKYDDCRFKDRDLFDLFILMLQHKKDDRPAITGIDALLQPIRLRLAV